MARFRLVTVITILSLLLPQYALSQSQPVDPGQDPFALTPEKQRLFQGFEGEGNQTQSLFDGGNMRDNGLFAPTLQQLGGAAPPPVSVGPDTPTTSPDANNGQQGSFILITSKYEPNTSLTSESDITVTVTVRNVSDHPIEDILFTARLKDRNADLLEEPAPDPALTSGPELGSAIEDPLEWEPFALEPGEERVFSWGIRAHEDDSILRWTLTAEFGAGQSILLQWIPIRNPNPTGPTFPGSGPSTGLPNICANSGQSMAFPGGSAASVVQAIDQRWGIQLSHEGGPDFDWTNPSNEPFLKFLWDAMSSVECTDFATNVLKDGPVRMVGSSIPSLWGYQAEANLIYYHLPRMRASGILSSGPDQLHQFFIHELGHVFRSKNFDIYTDYETNHCGSGSPTAYISAYGSTNCSEDFSEAIGYYAIRSATEWMSSPYCSSKNPYARGQLSHYNFIKTNVFGGIEFGTPPPSTPQPC